MEDSLALLIQSLIKISCTKSKDCSSDFVILSKKLYSLFLYKLKSSMKAPSSPFAAKCNSSFSVCEVLLSKAVWSNKGQCTKIIIIQKGNKNISEIPVAIIYKQLL
jgi:hypothetical protein